MTSTFAQGGPPASLLDGRLILHQPKSGYRVSLDAVMLGAASDPPEGAKVLDLGCGAGAATLCLLHRRPDLRAVGVELQPTLAALAQANAEANGMAERFHVVQADAARQPPSLRQIQFDWAISNPPFYQRGSGGDSPLDAKKQAHQEGSLDLDGWLGAILSRLRPGGGLTLVHRADRLPALLAALHAKAGAVALLPLWPKAGQPAKRILLSARKGSRSPARLLPGLVLHRDDGSYSDEAQVILRGGAGLSLSG